MATTFATPGKQELAEKSHGFAAALLAVYLFMLYSRIFEATQLIGISNLYLMLLLSVVGLVTVSLQGGLFRAAKTRAGILLLTFTAWAILILPFSSWKSESLAQLAGVWMKSLASFFIIVGLTHSFADVNRALKALGYGAAISAVLIALTTRNYQERATSFGTFGNSNEMAFHIVLGLPFLILLAAKSRVFLKIPLACIALLSVAEALKTASRGGLIMGAAVVIVALLTVSIQNKIKIAGIVLLAALVGALTISDTALERYKTIFSSSDSTNEARSARDSADARKALLQMSIDLTLAHPLFGVGMGDFAPAAAAVSNDRRQRAAWQVTHNSYTQLSCETGFLGAILIVTALLVCVGSLLGTARAAKQLGLTDIRNMAICILLGFVTLLVHFAFDALAYDFYFPMLAGLCMAFVYSARPLLLQAREKGRVPYGRAGSAASHVPSTLMSARRPAAKPLVQANEEDAIQGSNPYRLGRRRKNLR